MSNGKGTGAKTHAMEHKCSFASPSLNVGQLAYGRIRVVRGCDVVVRQRLGHVLVQVAVQRIERVAFVRHDKVKERLHRHLA